MNEGYIAAQRALDTNAALALSQLAARHATGEGALAGLLRERQDLVQELEGRDKLLIAAVAKTPDQRDRAGEDRLKSRIEEIGGRIDEIDRSLNKQAPEYAALSKPTPISIADTQALLKPDEALLQFIDLQSVGRRAGDRVCLACHQGRCRMGAPSCWHARIGACGCDAALRPRCKAMVGWRRGPVWRVAEARSGLLARGCHSISMSLSSFIRH